MLPLHQHKGVYSIRNLANTRLYIGRTAAPFSARWESHRTALQRRRHKNRELQRDWLELGCSSFVFEPLQAFPVNMADAYLWELLVLLERYAIVSATTPLYNDPKKSKPLQRYDLMKIEELTTLAWKLHSR